MTDLWVEVWKKNSPYNELTSKWNMHCSDDFVMCLGNFNGHVGWNIDGIDGFHGGYGVGLRNVEERMLVEFCLVKELCILNTL